MTRTAMILFAAIVMIGVVNIVKVYGLIGCYWAIAMLACCTLVQICMLPFTRGSGDEVAAPLWCAAAAWPVPEFAAACAASAVLLQVAPWARSRIRRVAELACCGSFGSVAVLGVLDELAPWRIPEPAWIDAPYLATCLALLVAIAVDRRRHRCEQCGTTLEHDWARFCGAACSQRWEAGE